MLEEDSKQKIKEYRKKELEWHKKYALMEQKLEQLKFKLNSYKTKYQNSTNSYKYLIKSINDLNNRESVNKLNCLERELSTIKNVNSHEQTIIKNQIQDLLFIVQNTYKSFEGITNNTYFMNSDGQNRLVFMDSPKRNVLNNEKNNFDKGIQFDENMIICMKCLEVIEKNEGKLNEQGNYDFGEFSKGRNLEKDFFSDYDKKKKNDFERNEEFYQNLDHFQNNSDRKNKNEIENFLELEKKKKNEINSSNKSNKYRISIDKNYTSIKSKPKSQFTFQNTISPKKGILDYELIHSINSVETNPINKLKEKKDSLCFNQLTLKYNNEKEPKDFSKFFSVQNKKKNILNNDNYNLTLNKNLIHKNRTDFIDNNLYKDNNEDIINKDDNREIINNKGCENINVNFNGDDIRNENDDINDFKEDIENDINDFKGVTVNENYGINDFKGDDGNENYDIIDFKEDRNGNNSNDLKGDIKNDNNDVNNFKGDTINRNDDINNFKGDNRNVIDDINNFKGDTGNGDVNIYTNSDIINKNNENVSKGLFNFKNFGIEDVKKINDNFDSSNKINMQIKRNENNIDNLKNKNAGLNKNYCDDILFKNSNSSENNYQNFLKNKKLNENSLFNNSKGNKNNHFNEKINELIVNNDENDKLNMKKRNNLLIINNDKKNQKKSENFLIIKNNEKEIQNFNNDSFNEKNNTNSSLVIKNKKQSNDFSNIYKKNFNKDQENNLYIFKNEEINEKNNKNTIFKNELIIKKSENLDIEENDDNLEEKIFKEELKQDIFKSKTFCEQDEYSTPQFSDQKTYQNSIYKHYMDNYKNFGSNNILQSDFEKFNDKNKMEMKENMKAEKREKLEIKMKEYNLKKETENDKKNIGYGELDYEMKFDNHTLTLNNGTNLLSQTNTSSNLFGHKSTLEKNEKRNFSKNEKTEKINYISPKKINRITSIAESPNNFKKDLKLIKDSLKNSKEYKLKKIEDLIKGNNYICSIDQEKIKLIKKTYLEAPEVYNKLLNIKGEEAEKIKENFKEENFVKKIFKDNTSIKCDSGNEEEGINSLKNKKFQMFSFSNIDNNPLSKKELENSEIGDIKDENCNYSDEEIGNGENEKHISNKHSTILNENDLLCLVKTENKKLFSKKSGGYSSNKKKDSFNDCMGNFLLSVTSKNMSNKKNTKKKNILKKDSIIIEEEENKNSVDFEENNNKKNSIKLKNSEDKKIGFIDMKSRPRCRSENLKKNKNFSYLQNKNTKNNNRYLMNDNIIESKVKNNSLLEEKEIKPKFTILNKSLEKKYSKRTKNLNSFNDLIKNEKFKNDKKKNLKSFKTKKSNFPDFSSKINIERKLRNKFTHYSNKLLKKKKNLKENFTKPNKTSKKYSEKNNFHSFQSSNSYSKLHKKKTTKNHFTKLQKKKFKSKIIKNLKTNSSSSEGEITLINKKLIKIPTQKKFKSKKRSYPLVLNRKIFTIKEQKSFITKKIERFPVSDNFRKTYKSNDYKNKNSIKEFQSVLNNRMEEITNKMNIN